MVLHSLTVRQVTKESAIFKEKSMKQLFFAFLVSTLLTSCMSTEKFTGFVEPKFQEKPSSYTNDNLTFDLTELEKNLPL